jgi:prepilin-type N-terminal cleavage/methylation domain-containing protein
MRPARSSCPARGRCAFTIVELLVVVAIIGTLIVILLPAVRHAQVAARMTNEKAAARELMLAYRMYADDNNDRVLPGYQDGLPAYTADRQPLGIPLGSRYPWRLAPYLNYRLDALYKNSAREDLEEMRNESPDEFTYLVSLFPSLGLNSAFVGGDSRYGGFLKPPADGSAYLYDLTGVFYVRRGTDVARPDRLIVFASARGGDPEDSAFDRQYEGYFSVLSPYWLPNQGSRWNDNFEYSDPPEKFGNVSMRYHGNAVVAMFDGHVETFGEDQMKDMRHWSHQAKRRDWRLGEK